MLIIITFALDFGLQLKLIIRLMKKTNNRWVIIIAHTLLAIVMMQTCRFCFYFFNRNFFKEIDLSQLLSLMRGGYILDMVAIGYGFLCYYLLMLVGQLLPTRVEMSRWYRMLQKASYFIPFILFLFLNVSDIGYFPYVLRRVNREVFSEFEGKSILGLYGDFVIEHWHLTLLFIVVLVLGVFCFRLFYFERPIRRVTPRWIDSLLSLGLIVFLFFSMRGRWDFKGMPVSIERVLPYMSHQDQYPILLNTPIALVKDGTTRQEYNFYNNEDLSHFFSPYYQAAPLAVNDSLFGSMRGRNIMVILLESMGSEYIGFLNQNVEQHTSRTPFLDTLLPQTLYARYGFSSGKRSVEAFPSIFVSLPAFGGTFNDKDWQMSNYQHFNSFDTGLPLSLRDMGYDLKFYHGDNDGAMGFWPFMQKLGVEKQYSGNDYLDDFPNNPLDKYSEWGIHDLPFELAMADDIDTLQEPFGVFFFSLSNHYPFKVPKNLDKKFKEGSLPIHKTAEYADFALQHFFEKIKEKPWYHNTLFVITADHANQSDHPAYDNLAGKAATPIAFFDPQGKLKGEISEYVVQHADIFPTILYLLGITEPVLSYGHNMLDRKSEHFALNFFGGQYLLYAKEVTITMTPDGQIRAMAPVLHLQTAVKEEPNEKVVEHYSNLLKGIVQDYNHRIFSTSFSIKNVVPHASAIKD